MVGPLAGSSHYNYQDEHCFSMQLQFQVEMIVWDNRYRFFDLVLLLPVLLTCLPSTEMPPFPLA